MKTERCNFIVWVKAHKKELVFAGISVTTVLGIICALKDMKALLNLWSSLKGSISKVSEKASKSMNVALATPPTLKEVNSVHSYTSPQKAFDVSQHIRNLPGGKHHSIEKAAEAVSLGIPLLPNQTIVDTYTKCAA